jgi:hypothetical protein
LPESKPIVPGKVRLAERASRLTNKEKRDSPLRLADRPGGSQGERRKCRLLRSE